MAKKAAKSKKLAKVKSLRELYSLAKKDAAYLKLLQLAALNLGGDGSEDIDVCYAWLVINANETDEGGVVDEINFCR